MLRAAAGPITVIRPMAPPPEDQDLVLRPPPQGRSRGERGQSAVPGALGPPGDAAEEASFESVPLFDRDPSGPIEARNPLPVAGQEPAAPAEASRQVVVEGLRCERDHFNHPKAEQCAQCGVSLAGDSGTVTTGPRPSLGVLLLDDGTTFTLDAEYLLGREPELDASVQNGRVRPLRLMDPNRSVSRVHATIDLEDWTVFVVDRGSSNGTYVAPRGAREWTRLQEHLPYPLPPGTRVAVGQRIMTFNTHHQTGE